MKNGNVVITEKTVQELTAEYKAEFGPSEVLEGDYRGNAIMIIRQSPEDHFPFQFGIKKARLILAHLPEIVAFAAAHPRTF